MSKILVTGASGNIGRSTLLHLLDKRPARDLVALVRDPAKAADLAARGIEIRQGDYLDRGSLARAFAGVDRVMLTSATAFTERNVAHGNVIEVAAEAGVEHVVFMPVHRRRGSTFAMKQITDEDELAVRKLRDSGLAYTLAEHPPFMESIPFFAGAKSEVRVTGGSGRFAAATRDDLAAAHAAILSGEGHENKTYALLGDPAVSFADVAAILTEISGTPVPYVPISRDAYFAHLKHTLNVPDAVAEFASTWVDGMNAGEWQEHTTDLETLLGRKPTTAMEYFRGARRAS